MTQKSTQKTEQLRRKAAELTELANWLDVDTNHPEKGQTEQLLLAFKWDQLEPDALLRVARKEYKDRRRRKEFLSPDLLGEPGWDILLDLFIAKMERRNISITSACVAADVPQTTALRWIGLLEQHGLVSKTNNAEDQRVTWVEITQEAITKISNLLKYNESSVNNYGFLENYLISNLEIDGD